MKAVVKTRPEPGNVELIDVPEPQAGPGHVVIEVHNAGVCGTDIHIYKSEYVIKPPVILGHELCGTIVEVGPGVTRCAVGDRVTVNPSAGQLCGNCRYCRIGAPFFCIDRSAVGSGMNGGFAKYCRVRQEIVFRLPENLDFETGALCEPFACALQAVVELTLIEPGEIVVVSGPGPIGIMCAMLAKSRGARVVLLGTSGDADRMAVAKRLGADNVVNVETDDPRRAIQDLTQGYGPDVVFECSGAPASAELCLDIVRKMGRYTQVGLFGKPLQMDLDKVVVKQIHLQGSMCHTWQTWERTLRFLEQDLVDLRPLITNRLPLSRWEEAFEGVIARKELKVLLHPEE
ncbi:MAG: zinc-binding dehydrogenase [Phycisphaerae bacterium]|nr:zinc-binding dehydrogenase [Phycisphaerae bacterium]